MTEVQEFNELLRKLNNDADASDRFWFKYYNMLKTHVKMKFGNYPDWEDIVQDIVNKIMSTDWTGYPYVDKPANWLYTIADNHAKDVLKKTNRVCEFKDTFYADFNIDYIDMRNDVRDAMKRLDLQTQYILYSHYWLGKELYVIADEMGISYGNVRVKISRARKQLKKFVTFFQLK